MSLELEDRVALEGEIVEDYDVTEEEREAYLEKLRGLVEAGGNPFVRVLFDANGEARVDAVGFDATTIPTVLREVADLMEAQYQ